MDADQREEPALESGPGRRLQEARKAANLTLVDVAAQLHLDTTTIEALEQDDYGKLPAPAFVRGYLRSYARLLDLAPGPVVNAYDSRGFEPPALVADISTSTQAQGESSDLPWRMMTYLVIAVVVTLVVLWWRNNMNDPFSILVGGEQPAEVTLPPVADGGADTSLDFQNRVRPEETAPLAGEPLPVPGADDPAEETVVPGEPPPVAVDAPQPAADRPLPEPAAPARETVTAEPLAPPPDTAQAPLETPPAPAPAVEQSLAANAPAAVTPPAEAPAPTQPAAGTAPANAASDAPPAPAGPAATASLSLDFAHDSWVEVYDAAGERLFFGMARSGRELDLEGRLPIRVLLGYARDIRVEYNGQLLDYSPYVNRGIARFTLGADGIRGDVEAAGTATPAE